MRAAIDRRSTMLERAPKFRPSRTPKRDQRAPMSESKAREIVYARSQGWCEVRLPGICLGRGAQWHHRRDRIHGGLWLPSNGLHVCGSPIHGCHGALTTPPAGQAGEFEQNGWTVPSNRDPADVAVLLPGGWAHLTEDETTIPKGAAA
jgi:hypothetical protein